MLVSHPIFYPSHFQPSRSLVVGGELLYGASESENPTACMSTPILQNSMTNTLLDATNSNQASENRHCHILTIWSNDAGETESNIDEHLSPSQTTVKLAEYLENESKLGWVHLYFNDVRISPLLSGATRLMSIQPNVFEVFLCENTPTRLIQH